ncbi:hypothetical protein ZWY2020_016609 [Hordeum vulgare]|nr:hypothetical protein ZWY2020_016609 [Hordeum vulgare]
MAEGGQAHPAAGDGRRWLAAAPPDLCAKVVQKILDNLCQVHVQGNQLEQLQAVASTYEAKVFSETDNVQDYLRTISIKMMMIHNHNKWQPVAQPAASESSHQPHMGGQMRPLHAVPVPAAAAAAVPPQASPSTTRPLVRPPQAQNMQISHKPSQQHPMAPVAVAQLRPCHPTAAAQIQTQPLSRHNNSGGMRTHQPVSFNHQAHMPLNAATRIQTAVPRTASTNRLPLTNTDQVQNMGINPMAGAQVQIQSMARHNSSGMRTQPPQTMSPRINQRQSYQAHGRRQSNVAASQIVEHSGGQNNQQFGHHPVEVDWREDMFQRITSLKRAHFSELVEFQRALRARTPHLEQADKYQTVVNAMAKIDDALSFLQLQKGNIPEAMKVQFDKHVAFIYGIVRWCSQIKLRNAGKNAGHQLPSPQVVHITGATDCQQKLQGQPAAEMSSSQSSENVPAATSPPVQHQENSHQLAGEETVDDDARREAEAPVATNLTGGSGTCSQEKQQEHHPAHEAIQQLMQNANPAETRPAQRQTKRSLSPAELRSLAREMGVNLKRAFRHMRTPSGSIDDGDRMWFDEPSSVESCNKRRKTHDGALQDEIAAAYSMLVETAIRITDDDDTRGADGAVVIELLHSSRHTELRRLSPFRDVDKAARPSELPTKLPVLLKTTNRGRGLQLACWTWSSDVPSASSRSPGQSRG